MISVKTIYRLPCPYFFEYKRMFGFVKVRIIAPAMVLNHESHSMLILWQNRYLRPEFSLPFIMHSTATAL